MPVLIPTMEGASARKKRRTSSKTSASGVADFDHPPKDEEFKTREELLRSIRASTDAELQVFSTSKEEKEEKAETDKDSQLADYNSLTSYPDVLCELVKMYVKLRRFPKLIAKLLCCFRDYIVKDRHFKDVSYTEDGGKIFPIELFLPDKFIAAFGGAISELPVGQIMDLLKTLYYNLREECIKPISQQSGNSEMVRVYFLSIVTKLFCEYLINIKVADYSVSASTIEKVSDMMMKVREECLTIFGKAILEKKHDTNLISSFLTLAHTWAELHGLLVQYKNDMYESNTNDLFQITFLDNSPLNLSFMHPYLPSESWLALSNQIEISDDKACKSLLVMLVVQKLKYMIILGKPTTYGPMVKDSSELLKTHLHTTAKYILSQEESCKLSLHELYKLTSKYLDDTQIIDLVRSVVKHGSAAENDVLIDNSSLNGRFEAILTLEVIDFIFTRMSKMKVLPKWCRKKITHEIFSADSKIAIVPNLSSKNATIFSSFLSVVNKSIEMSNLGENENDETMDENSDYVADEIMLTKLNYLNRLSLEDYPTNLKTMVALSSIIILLTTASKFEKADDIIEILASILHKSADQSKGNETLFGISWVKLYTWFYSHASKFSMVSLKRISLVILRNIYISTKSVAEFELESDLIHEELSMGSPTTTVRLVTLEFLIKELPVITQTRSKLTPQVQDHIRKLASVVAKALKKSNKRTKTTTIDVSLLSNIFHACWLMQLALPIFSLETTESESMIDSDNNITRLKRICCKHVDSAFEILLTPNRDENDMDMEESDVNADVRFAKAFALIFLHTVCKTRGELGEGLPESFINQLWAVCMNVTDELWGDCVEMASSENTNLLPKVVFEVSTQDEFAELKNSMLNEMTTLLHDDKQEAKLEAFIHILDCLLDSILTIPEKRDDRRQILDGILGSMTQLSLQWNHSNVCLKRMVLPTLKFQIKLLQRRNAISSPTFSATCLSSITCVPLHEIENTKLYSELFCSAADLLNAFTVHRLDVISFRMPIYLQCFQFLIESVTSKANQDNKLSDEEIIQLKYCAHRIERTCQSMTLNQKEFWRVSPYFVAIMMRQFEMFAVYPAVKGPLLSGCYKLLDLCDNHGVAQLNSMLTVGSRETFKSVYELYNKFYRYKGKV